jgi:hypothetical protein
MTDGPRVTFSTVRSLALALPGVEESTTYGTAAFKWNGHLIACRAINRSAEPDSLVVCVPIADRDELIATDPGVYYLTDHYVSGACVLVRLRRIHRDALSGLLRLSWQFVSAKKERRPTRAPGARRSRKSIAR